MKKSKKIIIFIGAAVLVIAILVSIWFFFLKPCNHQWENATCEKPTFCVMCGEAAGNPLGHRWKDATCTNSKTCIICNQISSEAAGHSWNEATCTVAKMCSVCKTTEGDALGHTWVAATYSTPKTCSICGVTEGKALTKPAEPNIVTCLLCDLKTSRKQTQYCEWHDCGITDCPYPAKSIPGHNGSYCIHHSCEKDKCLSKKQQKDLPYCHGHLSGLSQDEIEDLRD